MYVADWYDARTAHPDPDAEWDRTNGRIYRIAYGNRPPVRDLDLNRKSSAELVKLLAHPNDWYARTARRVLADRRDPEVILPLRTAVRQTTGRAGTSSAVGPVCQRRIHRGVRPRVALARGRTRSDMGRPVVGG